MLEFIKCRWEYRACNIVLSLSPAFLQRIELRRAFWESYWGYAIFIFFKELINFFCPMPWGTIIEEDELLELPSQTFEVFEEHTGIHLRSLS